MGGWISELSKTDLHLAGAALRDHHERSVDLTNPFEEDVQGAHGKNRFDVAGSQINDPHDRFHTGHSQTAKVAVVRQDDSILCTRLAKDDEVAGTDEATLLDVQQILTAVSQEPHHLRMNVFVRQESEIPQLQ